MIMIKKSKTADTRSCDYSKVSMEQLEESSKQHTESNTMSDAMGKMLIYLIENNLLKASAK